jgi:hypothetical protein
MATDSSIATCTSCSLSSINISTRIPAARYIVAAPPDLFRKHQHESPTVAVFRQRTDQQRW